MIQLGLIGEGIAQSQSPDLHTRLGRAVKQDIRYDLVDSFGRKDFEFAGRVQQLRAQGFHGTNVTFPFKEQAARLADSRSDGVKRVGTANTLLFENDRLHAENTDYTGFISAYRRSFNNTPPGNVLLIGAGGVGRAVACALGELNANQLYVLEPDRARRNSLVADLNEFGVSASAIEPEDRAEIMAECQGVVNCTPMGHINHPGCPIDTRALTSRHWVFDAVYIPAHTELLKGAAAAGSSILSGVDLFVFQGIDAFRLFTRGLVDSASIDAEIGPLRQYYLDQLVRSTTPGGASNV